jgi:predicted acetyltransferase
MAKLRQFITEEVLTAIGNVGYAIRPGYRNMGYGKLLLGLLVQRAKALSIDRLVLTINADNPSSVAVALANGGKVDRSSDGRLIVSIHI